MGISHRKKLLLVEFQDYTCELCRKKFDFSKLQIHRIRRGCSYKEHRSLMVICGKCHKELHQEEIF